MSSQQPEQADLRSKIEAVLHLNGCQQRTAGYNDFQKHKEEGIDLDDCERLEKQTLEAVMEIIASHKEER